VRAQGHGFRRRRVQQRLDFGQRAGEPAAGRRRQPADEAFDHPGGAVIEGREDRLAVGREAQSGAAPIAGRTFASDNAVAFEAPDDAAEIAGVQAGDFADAFGGHPVAGGDLIEHAALRQGVVRTEVALLQHPYGAGVEAVEPADCGDGIGSAHDVALLRVKECAVI
jgi:hypothetical protein